MPYKDPEKRRAAAREGQRRYRERYPERVALTVKEWEARNPEAAHIRAMRRAERDPLFSKRDWYQRRYGITIEDRERMFAAQDGICAICASAPAEHIDHDHRTGLVRALLCGRCNRGIGMFDDDPARLRDAADYLASARLKAVG
jgi:hypothetical protein